MTAALLSLLLAAPAARPFTPDELLQTRRLDDPQVSPDGKRATFTVRQKNLAENRDSREVFMLDLPSGAPRPFTRDGHSDHARFSPDGRKLLLVSERGGGEGQLWLYDLESGGDGRKLTALHGGAADGVFSPDGKLIAFTAEVNPLCGGNALEVQACTKKRAEDRAKNKLRAHLTDRLLFRHWNEWREQTRTHVFVMPADGGAPKDLTPGDADWPTWKLGGGGDLAFSRDGKRLASAGFDKLIRLWDISTGDEVLSLRGHEGGVVSLAFSPDGLRHFSGGVEGVARVWDARLPMQPVIP